MANVAGPFDQIFLKGISIMSLQSAVDDYLAGERRALELREKLLKEIVAVLLASAPNPPPGAGKLHS